MKFESALEAVISTFLNVEDYDLESVAKWARRQDLPEVSREKRDHFKTELEHALKEGGTVTPQLFEKWTFVDLETQDEVQEHLQEVWDVCFEDPKVDNDEPGQDANG